MNAERAGTTALWRRSFAYASGEFLAFSICVALIPYIPSLSNVGKDSSPVWAIPFVMIVSLLDGLGFRIGLIAFDAPRASTWEQHRFWLAFVFGVLFAVTLLLLRPFLIKINVGIFPGFVEGFVGSIVAALLYRRLVGMRNDRPS
ncbi:MAG: hypothetical protein KA271_04830 [Propionivibrio sp.]|nr:hypothetical protein [Propionivibrio sp.]